MTQEATFKDCAIIACGSLIPELNKLKEAGFLDAARVIYTSPGLHQRPLELEHQLLEALKKAKDISSHILVVYGGRYCYLNAKSPERSIDTVISEEVEEGITITRTDVFNCVDMVVSERDQEKMAEDEKCWFCTPGWMKYREKMFEGWDKAIANENFPKYTGGAVMLDTVDYFNGVMMESPEEILDFSDWMGIPLDARTVSLDRVKEVLISALEKGVSVVG